MKDTKNTKEPLSKKAGEKLERFGEKISNVKDKVEHKIKDNLHRNKK